MRMAARLCLASAAFGALFGSAAAEELATSGVPLFARNLPAQPQEPSIWSGLYVGNEVFAISGKGVKGGFGGAGFIGYDHAFANDVVVGVRADAGYSPSLARWGASRGFDFASANVSVGYEIGRFRPFVAAGVALAKPDVFGRGFTTTSDAVNDLFDQASSVRAYGTVGAGLDYAVTDKLTVSVAVSAGAGRGLAAP
jgi:opacity protein-like surface antigen